MARCAFLGLGVMGAPMAGHLVRAGHEVTVWNRTASKMDTWIKNHNGRASNDPAEAAFGQEFIFLCLGDDPDVAEVYGAVEPNIGGGMVVVDHTTGSASLARDLAERAARRGARFLDAPISGGQAGAQKGGLAIMCGGDEPAFAMAKPIMSAYGKQIVRIGDSGAGQLTKSVNQICIAGLLQGLSEGLNFAEHAELDVEKVIQAISGGAAQSWQMVNRWQTMLADEFDHGFAVDWMRKDLRIALEAGRENNSHLPVTQTVDDYYREIQDMGGGRWDTSSLIKRLK